MFVCVYIYINQPVYLSLEGAKTRRCAACRGL